MKLVIGLGNPEKQYEHTRHNVGFHALDHFASEKGATFQHKDKFKADVAELNIEGEKVILAKPTTYYNLSGEAARAISDFHKIVPQDVLIVHDELALPFGTIRTRLGGSDAGNNGIKSVNDHLGPDTARVRIGIYNELRDRADDRDFVLGKFTAEESKLLESLYEKSRQIITSFIDGTFDSTTHK